MRLISPSPAHATLAGPVAIAATLAAGAGLTMAWMGPFGPYLVAYVSVFVLAAVALNVVIGWAGMVSAGHGGLLAIGGYTYALVASHGHSVWLALLASIAVGGVVGAFLALPTFRTSGLFYAIITLAFGVVVGQLIIVFDDVTKGSNGLAVDRPTIAGISLVEDSSLAWFGVTVAAIGIIVVGAFRHSVIGRRIVTVKSSEPAARALGLDPRRYKLIAMVLSAAVAALAGALYGIVVGYLSPGDFGIDLSILLLAMTVVGGTRYLIGPVLGAVLLAGVSQSWATLAEYDALFFGAILTATTVLFGSGGLTGAAVLVARLLRRTARQAHGEVPNPAPSSLESSRNREPRLEEWSDIVPEETHVLAIRDLSVDFGGVKALSHVDLTVHSRDLLGLIGPNGAGKSTLFNCASGFVRPTSGSVELLGVDVTSVPVQRRAARGLGRTFQEMEMINELSVRESLLVSRVSTPDSPSFGDVDELARLLGLGDVLEQRPTDLSYGIRKRAALARALAAEPAVLLLDEPAAGLTDREAGAMADLLRQLYDQSQLTLVVVEHNMSFLRRLVDSVALMQQGQLVTRVPVGELDSDATIREAYL
ncbi:branched-chain amino acid ABC transporter ATP-binding protein/permease [soil metagenome]